MDEFWSDAIDCEIMMAVTPTTVGYYDDLCDSCLFDRHYCPVCENIVGHGHSHSE